MESADIVDALSWAFTAVAAEGIPVLEEAALRMAWAGSLPLGDVSHTAISATFPGLDVDAREMMSALLSTSAAFASPAQLALYVVLMSRVYTGLFQQTMARQVRVQRAQLPPDADVKGTEEELTKDAAKVRVAAATTMGAWAKDVTAVLTHAVLPQLHLCDAQPRTLTTSQQLTTRGQQTMPSGDAVPSDAAGDGDIQDQQQLHLVKALCDYRVADALIHLMQVMYHSTRDDTVCPLLLAVYATVHQMEVFPRGAGFADPSTANTVAMTRTSEGSVLQRWRCRFVREVGSGPKGSRIAPLEVPPPQLKATGVEAALCSLRSLLDEMVRTGHVAGATDLWSFAVTHLSGRSFAPVSEATMFSTAFERGAAPPDTTAALLARERAEEVEACTLVVTDSVEETVGRGGEASSDASGEVGGATVSPLSRQGALLLLGDALRDAALFSTPLYTVSSSSLLLCVADVYATVLTCASCATLMRHLLLLHDILATIPKYSLDCAEGSIAHQQARTVMTFDACLTRRYEYFFEVAKALLGVSALCPSDEHRCAARVIAVELLERLKEEPRVRMHLSLLTLCPYPSIARFFLDRLLEDWQGQAAGGSYGAESGSVIASSSSSASLACLVPVGLAECMTTFLQHLVTGTRGFVDPLIAALNFVRVEASRRAWISALAQLSTTPQPRRERHASDAWAHLFEVLRQRVLPQCDALVAPADEKAAVSSFALPPLSPLDMFSLSYAVEGVRTLFAVHSTA